MKAYKDIMSVGLKSSHSIYRSEVSLNIINHPCLSFIEITDESFSRKQARDLTPLSNCYVQDCGLTLTLGKSGSDLTDLMACNITTLAQTVTMETSTCVLKIRARSKPFSFRC